MASIDLNQLVTLDVLLEEQSVTAAARRLQLSPSAMSRALARLRETLGDPLLVRAGRALVPTPRALALRAQVAPVVERAAAILRPAVKLDLRTARRSFTVRTSDGFVEAFGAALIARVERDAPGIQLRFVSKPDKDSAPLRTGAVDLETGVLDEQTGPELRALALFRDEHVGVMRADHPLARKKITVERFARARHVAFARAGDGRGAIDDALAALGQRRTIVAIVNGFATAVALARETELFATVPARHTRTLRARMRSFALPFALAPFTVSMLWHPRLDADPAHRWLREQVLAVVQTGKRASTRA